MAEAKKQAKNPVVTKPAAKASTKKAAVKAPKVETTVVEAPVLETPVVETEAPVTEVKATVAKAGKRSEKAVKESEEKEAKEERKAHASEEAEAPTPKAAPKARTRIERAGKGYRKLVTLIDKSKEYTMAEALELATKTSPVKFDASVELHVRLNVDPRQADQNIRDSIVLPAGTGKNVRVAVFAEADDVAIATKAGADIAGTEEFLASLDKGIIDFDVLVATPQVMAKLGKYARILGPKGLMPNPKSGTVTKDVAKAVKEAKAGRVEFRVDSTGIVHLAIGKVSFGPEKLGQNVAAIAASLKNAKPASVKSGYVKSVFVTTSMGPSIRVATNELN
jgi:large subunit ribosomal protein L1